jgi:Circularly permutated YpsA SLOG family
MDLSKPTPGYHGLDKVISGGQTGADQAGLLAAHKVGLCTGGTAPAGFWTSKGPNYLLSAFGLKDEGTLQTRTKKNVADSDATVILSGDMQSSGTLLTIKYCNELNRRYYPLDIASLQAEFGDTGVPSAHLIDEMGMGLCTFIVFRRVRTLNVAGNRERFDDGRTTKICQLILSRAFQYLDLEGFLVRDTDL